jgi:uncharacterized protein YbaR (Trm112 family)
VAQPAAPPAGIPKGALEVQGELDKPTALRCRQCGRVYKFQDGIPNLLLEDAQLPGDRPAN